jgi:signal peptidase I
MSREGMDRGVEEYVMIGTQRLNKTWTEAQAPGTPFPVARISGVLFNALMATSILMALLVFASGSLPALMGLKTMVVSSGSMEPAIHTGDAVTIETVTTEDIQIGDVITFGDMEGHGMVTHRVIAIEEMNGTTYFQTQGDANRTADPNLASADAVYGRVKLTLPMAGYLLFFAATALGKLTLIGLPLLFLMVQEVRKLMRENESRKEEAYKAASARGTLNEPATTQ